MKRMLMLETNMKKTGNLLTKSKAKKYQSKGLLKVAFEKEES